MHCGWDIHRLEMLFLALKRFLPHLRVGQDGQHDCGLEPESLKKTTFSATVQVGKACPFLSTDQVSVSQNSPCPRSYEHRSQNLKTGLGGRRMDVTPSWSEDLLASSMTTHCLLWFVLSLPLPLGVDSLGPDFMAFPLSGT